MTIAGLSFIADMMEDMEIPYSFMEWMTERPPPDTYCIGHYLEGPTSDREENGHQETTFILRLFTKKDWLTLEQMRETIERNITKTAVLSDGTGIAIFYESGTPIHTGVPDFKSYKINLKIQEWSVK